MFAKNYYLHCTSIFMSLKSVCQIFKILFQTGDINIFVLRGVFFNTYVQLKSSFSDKKNISEEIWDTLWYRSYWKLLWQSIKGKFHHWQKLELCKLFTVQNYAENANGDVPLTVENVRCFQFLWVQPPHMFFLCKRYFYSMTLM